MTGCVEKVYKQETSIEIGWTTPMTKSIYLFNEEKSEQGAECGNSVRWGL